MIIIFSVKPLKGEEKGLFVNLVRFDDSQKKELLFQCIRKISRGEQCSYSYWRSQIEFKKIPGYPFVYWISDRIRELFRKYKPLVKYADVRQGCATGDNDRFLRFWWEVEQEDISLDYKSDRKKWVPYAKGGPYNKWYGNLWWAVDYSEETYKVLKNMGNKLPSESYYFREGLTYGFISSLGFTVRYLPYNCIFDVMGSSAFMRESNGLTPTIAVLSSSTTSYLIDVLNPTAAYQVGDLKNIPTAHPSALGSKSISSEEIRDLLGGLSTHSPLSTLNSVTLSSLAQDCIELKKELYGFHVMERDFKHDPLSWGERVEEGRPVRVRTP